MVSLKLKWRVSWISAEQEEADPCLLLLDSHHYFSPHCDQVGFQKILTLTYVDKFIDDVQLHFRDRYKNELEQKGALKLLNSSFDFEDRFKKLLR